MSAAFKVACVQNCAVAEVERNIDIAARLTQAAIDRGAAIVCLPEYFSGVALKDGLLHPAAFEESRHPVLQAFADLARARRAWLLLGSLGVHAADGRIFNRGYLLDPQGAVAARYDKIHMFDVELIEGAPLRESATIAPGDCAVLADTGFCTMGLTICYDLRFPHLYRAAGPGRRRSARRSGRLHQGDGRSALARAEPRPGHREWLLRGRALPIWHFARRGGVLRPFADRRPLGHRAGRWRGRGGGRAGGHRSGGGGPGPQPHSSAQSRPTVPNPP